MNGGVEQYTEVTYIYRRGGYIDVGEKSTEIHRVNEEVKRRKKKKNK